MIITFSSSHLTDGPHCVRVRRVRQEELQKHGVRAAHNLRYVKKNILNLPPGSPGDGSACGSALQQASGAGPPPPRGSRSFGSATAVPGGRGFVLSTPSPLLGEQGGRAGSWFAGAAVAAGPRSISALGFGPGKEARASPSPHGLCFLQDSLDIFCVPAPPALQGYAVNADPTHPVAMPSFSRTSPPDSWGRQQPPAAEPHPPSLPPGGGSFTFARPGPATAGLAAAAGAGGAASPVADWADGNIGAGGGWGGSRSMASGMSRERPMVHDGQAYSPPGASGRPARTSEPTPFHGALYVSGRRGGAALSQMLGGGGGSDGAAQEVPREEMLLSRGSGAAAGGAKRAAPRAVSSFKF